MRQRHFDDFLGNRPAIYAEDLLKRVGVKHPPVDPRMLADFRGYEIREVSAEEHPQFQGLAGILRKSSAHLLRNPRVIIVYRDMHRLRKRSSTFHEIGHDILPHHDGLNFSCSEKSVDSAIKLAEREAFLTGGHLMFPSYSFIEDARSFQLGTSAIQQLSRKYDSPLEYAAKFYAKMSGHRCAILVAEPPSLNGNGSENHLETRRGTGQLEFSLNVPRRSVPPAPIPPLAVSYFVQSALFHHFIFPGAPIHAPGLIFQSWQTDSPMRGEIPAWDFGVNNRYVRYYAECHPFGLPGQRKVLVLLWLADYQRTFGFFAGGKP